jgi:lauroyl/myristoyl acyltransferase
VNTLAFTELPWMRRERADANIRHAIGELKALAVEDTGWAGYYRAMAETLEAAIKVLDAIEDHDDPFSRRVTH